MIYGIDYQKHHVFLHSMQLAYFMSNLMNCYTMILKKKKNKVMCQSDASYLLKQGKTLMYIFSKIRDIYYHCDYQSVCKCRIVHYLYSNINACSNLLYIAPAEQTTP